MRRGSGRTTASTGIRAAAGSGGARPTTVMGTRARSGNVGLSASAAFRRRTSTRRKSVTMLITHADNLMNISTPVRGSNGSSSSIGSVAARLRTKTVSIKPKRSAVSVNTATSNIASTTLRGRISKRLKR